MTPEDWRAAQPGMGSCFHQALHRWADLRAEGFVYKVAIGVVQTEPGDRHLHAWLQAGDIVISAPTGDRYERTQFYQWLHVERVGLVNPRSIMRRRKGVIDKQTVTELLNASGIRWRSVNGGVLPA